MEEGLPSAVVQPHAALSQEPPMRPVHDVVARLRAEYVEMPGMRLKAQQVQRLCGIEPMVCQSALDALVEAKFLCVISGGHYACVTDAEFAAPMPRSQNLVKPGAGQH